MNRSMNDVWAIRQDHAAIVASIMAGEYGAEHDGGKAIQGEALSIIPLKGIITQDGSPWGTGARQFGAWMDEAADDKQTRAIIIDANSPGGSVFGIEEATEKVRAAAEKKPVIAVASGMMDSACYWLCSGARKIVASPSADIGSIGVIIAHTDFSESDRQVGVKTTFVTSAKYKAEGNASGPLDDKALGHMQSRVDAYHRSFVDDIGKGRGLSVAAVNSGYGEGRSFGAAEAKDRGMVDQIASLDTVIHRLLPRTSTNRARMKMRVIETELKLSACQRR